MAKANLDKDWVYLISLARDLGITAEEVREFLQKKRVKKT
ncbi:anti-repressor SinI family protein [Virgibacillus sp. JSM 102003]